VGDGSAAKLDEPADAIQLTTIAAYGSFVIATVAVLILGS
jgi:hypothetical protein